MKCPYAVDRILATKTNINYDDDGKETSSLVTHYNKVSFAECKKSECGAYNPKTEKCEYHVN